MWALGACIATFNNATFNNEFTQESASLHKSQQLKSEHYVSSVGNFWEVSEHVLQRIESPSAVAGRDAFCEYLNDTPWVAKRKGINFLQISSRYMLF